jgi:hypothetical protein
MARCQGGKLCAAGGKDSVPGDEERFDPITHPPPKKWRSR